MAATARNGRTRRRIMRVKLNPSTSLIRPADMLHAVQAVMHKVTTGELEADCADSLAAESVLSFIVLHLRKKAVVAPDDLVPFIERLAAYAPQHRRN